MAAFCAHERFQTPAKVPVFCNLPQNWTIWHEVPLRNVTICVIIRDCFNIWWFGTMAFHLLESPEIEFTIGRLLTTILIK